MTSGSPSRFTVVQGERLYAGDVVCIDPTTGYLRRTRPGDRNSWEVPPDAWQDGDMLCIPAISVASRRVRQ